MSDVFVVYGSATGVTEGIARRVAEQFKGAEVIEAARLDESVAASLSGARLVLLGTSTWGFGDLQDDWHAKLPVLENASLKGVKVAVFGTGDQESYPDTFVDGIGILAEAAEKAGATVVGLTSTDGYTFDESRAVRDDKFLGLAIDEDNQSDMTDDRLDAWIAHVQTAIAT